MTTNTREISTAGFHRKMRKLMNLPLIELVRELPDIDQSIQHLIVRSARMIKVKPPFVRGGVTPVPATVLRHLLWIQNTGALSDGLQNLIALAKRKVSELHSLPRERPVTEGEELDAFRESLHVGGVQIEDDVRGGQMAIERHGSRLRRHNRRHLEQDDEDPHERPHRFRR